MVQNRIFNLDVERPRILDAEFGYAEPLLDHSQVRTWTGAMQLIRALPGQRLETGGNGYVTLG